MTSVNTVEPDDFLFWQEVRKAYDQVALNNEREITFEHGARKAEVTYVEEGKGIEIFVTEITNYSPHEERLIVP